MPNMKPVTSLQGHKSKAEREVRAKAEEKLKGNSDKVFAPRWLDKEAKKEFNRVAKELKSIKLINNLDVTVLAIYCDAYSNFVKLTKQIQEEGATISYTNAKGATNEIVSPKVQAQQKYTDTIMKCASKMGLSISDRLKLIVPKPVEETPVNKFAKFAKG